MRITGFNIAEGRVSGLKALKADKLGGVVVLAGRNGAGKSRLIRYLAAWKETPFGYVSSYNNDNPTRLVNSIRKYAPDLFGPKSSWNACHKNIAALLGVFSTAWEEEIRANIEEVFMRLSELQFDSPQEPCIVHFVPKIVGLADPLKQTRDDLISRADIARSALGVEKIEHNALARIQHLQNRYTEVTHQNCILSPSIVEPIKHEYEQLQSLIIKFFGRPLERNSDGDATLLGLRLGMEGLSDGQCIILQFCVAIHSQAHRLSELIVMMDEPENHLHPAAMLDAVNEIRRHLTKGQLWIATHSLPLLANFNPDCIWWMDDGTISHAGSTPEIVLKGLLGEPERIEQLEDFLGLPAAMAINNFTAQCLLPPAVVVTGHEDKQLKQMRDALIGLRKQGQPLSVLDVGAGRGRLIAALAALSPDTAQTIDYLALDTSTVYKDECEDAIARCYGSGTRQRWFEEEKALKAQVSAHCIDVIVMCNVLHEIDPNQWLLGLFGPHGTVGHFLKKGGSLLLVEDTEMRIGEKAHDKGFLVLNAGNLRTLFDIKNEDAGFVFNTEQNDRLMAARVPSDCVSRATQATLLTTLGQVRHEASGEIQKLRKSNTYRHGRKLAFHLQQFANAALTMESMGGG